MACSGMLDRVVNRLRHQVLSHKDARHELSRLKSVFSSIDLLEPVGLIELNGRKRGSDVNASAAG
jgi:hypothetical protein